MKRYLTLLAALVLFGAQETRASVTWGSFDASRINYSAGALTGSDHSILRAIIQSNDGDGIIGAVTPTLTDTYLGGVDVFYTSLLSQTAPILSTAEKAALQNWVGAGGTLIVTADMSPLPAYEAFTSVYGVTNYQSVLPATTGTGTPVAAHRITQDISSYYYAGHCTFTYGSDALLLGDDGSGHDFMIVMEPGTGFSAGGRILVLGDHNIFVDDYIGEGPDNAALAVNIASWAATPVAMPGDFEPDGDVDADDIDLLFGQVPGTVPPAESKFDLTSDSILNQADVDELIHTILGTEYGDANLDKAIDGGDLALLGAKWLQSGFGWADGNFNGDVAIDGGDLSLLGANWLWTATAGAVPEPATLSLLALGGMALVRRRRK